MIDVFMIFTMTIPLLEIIGHTYAEHLRLKMIELDELSDPQKLPLTSSNASVSIQPLGFEGSKSKLDLPLVKSKLFANDKRSKLSRTVKIHLKYIPFQATPREKSRALQLLSGCACSHSCGRWWGILVNMVMVQNL